MKGFIKQCIFLLSITYSGFLITENLNNASILLDPVPDINQVKKEIEHANQPRKKSISATSSELIDFNYTNHPLKDLLNHFAEKLSLNILYPETETITAQVTFDAGKKITVAEAWNFIVMMIDHAGYTLINKEPNSYMLTTNAKAYLEPLELYIGCDIDQIPNSMQKIRFVYFFNNIQLSNPNQKNNLWDGNTGGILASMINPQTDIKNQVIFDTMTNSMILTTRADLVKSIIQLIKVLDETGFQQAIELFKLEYAQAKEIVDLFKSILTNNEESKKSGFVNVASGPRAKYFSDNVRVENLDPANIRQLNTLVLMGKPNDITQIKTFIKKYLDIPQESGDSFFHVIELQWIQASHLANVLNNLIQGTSSSSGQSTSSANLSELNFDPHIKVVAETISQGDTNSASNSSGQPNTVQRGANKIVIACAPKDWQRIHSLIKQLDVPQRQVLIEALIVDLNLNFVRKLGAQIRTRGILPSIFPKNLQAQAGLLDYNVIQSMTDSEYNSLVGDLSDILNPDWPGSGTPDLTASSTSSTIPVPDSGNPPNTGAANGGFAGNTVLMLSGSKSTTNGVWAFFQMLAQHVSSKVFTRPTLLISNNQSGMVTSQFTKNLAGTVTQGTNPTINYVQVTAPIIAKFTPLISQNNIINLQIDLNLTTYANPDDANSGAQFLRQIKTNISVKSGDVLILGGLTTEVSQTSKRSVPFFESIPIIGNIFASRSKNATKSQLFILVRSTISEPRKGGGMNKMTQNAADFIVDQLADTENNFANLKDPITRWFFNSDNDATASELVEIKIDDMSKKDFNKDQFAYKTGYSGEHILNSSRNKEKMTVGWFSNAPTNNTFASESIKENRSDQKMDQITQLLKDMQNPFEMNRITL